MKFAQLFLRSLPRLASSSLFNINQRTARVAISGLGLGVAAWMTSSKVFSEELVVLETDDDLQ